MTKIVESITRVTDIMGEIASASHEQTISIEQVNSAITQMDEVTQQNAALVKEAAAAAGSLHDQSDVLAQLVGKFKLEEGTASSVTLAYEATAPTKAAPGRALSPPRKAVVSNADQWEAF